MKILKSSIWNYFLFIVLIVLSLFVFGELVKNPKSDFGAHVGQILKINKGLALYPSNFLFYYIVNLLSFFSQDYLKINVAVKIVLTVAVIWKFQVSKKIIQNACSEFKSEKFHSIILIVSLGLLFCFAIPDPLMIFTNRMYLGKLVPSVWHNSTTIAVFPLAILLFYKQLNALENQNRTTLGNIAIICVLILLNVIVKPSFIFVYIPATFILIIIRFRQTKYLINKLTPLFFAILLVLSQYFLIYQFQLGSFQQEPSGIAISYPFELISNWIPIWFIPISYLFSLALPLYCVFKFREFLNYLPIKYSLLLLIIGIIISAFLIETGPRAGHGNFTWQNVICTYLVFLSCLIFVTKKYLKSELNIKSKRLVILLFSLHIFSGVFYLVRVSVYLNHL